MAQRGRACAESQALLRDDKAEKAELQSKKPAFAGLCFLPEGFALFSAVDH
jgi:hypothetical protein